MTVGDLVGASGLSKEGYLKSIVQPAYWGSEIELYLLSWLLNMLEIIGNFVAVTDLGSQS